jgi:hypothetical protein|tara:strand:+ start:531 stop:668 length:138 start_codon:yes stop_codon:yes gene_type:complete
MKISLFIFPANSAIPYAWQNILDFQYRIHEIERELLCKKGFSDGE